MSRASAPEHYNPSPMFGLRDLSLEPPEYYEEYYSGDWDACIECGEEFHYDDIGGYNPPCSCGLHCRSCHELEEQRGAYGDGDYYDDDRAEYEERVIREVYNVNGGRLE
jgi:hypothetical protein